MVDHHNVGLLMIAKRERDSGASALQQPSLQLRAAHVYIPIEETECPAITELT